MRGRDRRRARDRRVGDIRENKVGRLSRRDELDIERVKAKMIGYSAG